MTDSKLDAKLEEIRDRLLRRLYPCDFTSVKDYDKDRALIEAALREAVEAAKQEADEAHAYCNEIGLENVANPGPDARLLTLRERISALDARRLANELRPTESTLHATAEAAVAQEREACAADVERALTHHGREYAPLLGHEIFGAFRARSRAEEPK